MLQTAYDSGTLFFQNWAKHVKPGGVGYKSDIDPIKDLTNKTIETAIIMHAVKVSKLHYTAECFNQLLDL